jgi:uracil-DNA glycosylase
MTKEELFTDLQNCKECRYSDWEVNIWNEVHGYGKYGSHVYSDDAKVMIVGQNPSNTRFSKPLNFSLSGHQGDPFREIFGEKNLILTNLVQISTPDNKILDIDAAHGLSHLMREIEFHSPRLIIALGRFCRDFVRPNLAENVVYLKHPDYFMTYNKSQLDLYIESIKDIKNQLPWIK